LLAAWLAWFGSRWTRFLNGIGEDGARGGGKGMAGVAAALGGSGPGRGRAPVRAGGTGVLGTRVGGDGRLMAAGYMAICLTGKAATQLERDGRQVGN
jgi:hypothetical protein